MKFIRKPEHKRPGVDSDGWTVGVASSRYHEFVPGTPYERWGVAFLFYRPQRRLSLSVWLAPLSGGHGGWSRNFRLFGPHKLSWQ